MTKVKEIMDRKVVTIQPREGVRDVCRLLIKHRLSGVPVVDHRGRLVGFISERDIIGGAAKSKDFMKKKVGDMMKKKVTFIPEEMNSEEVAKIFTDCPFRYLPVVKNKLVIGLVTRKEVITKLLTQYY